jgi:glycosyltransferase involved in cell wall biosynthesis
MEKPKKIAFVYDAIYPYIKGGAERRYYEIGKRLAAQGYDVHLYGMKLWQGADIIHRDGMTLHGICNAKNLYTTTGKRSTTQAIYFGLSCFRLFSENFDVIDCCGFPYFSLFSCKIVCLFKGEKLYSTWHEVWGSEYWKDYVGSYALLATIIEKVASSMPDVIISVSQTTKKKLQEILTYKKEIIISPNGIDLEEIQKITPSILSSDIIYAGRLMNFKHIDILIRAVAEIKKIKKDIICLIIGDGPEKEKLEKLTEELKLQKNIIFLGFLDHHNEVYAYFKSSKVFVLPSTREGFGIAILEANACGLKAITVTSPNNAASELINKYTGELAELDLQHLAKCIERMLNKYNDKSEKKEIEEHYNWDIITSNLLSVYR